MHRGRQLKSSLLIITLAAHLPLCLTQVKKIKSLNRNLLHYNKNKILINQSLILGSRVNKYRDSNPLFPFKDKQVLRASHRI